MNIFSLLKTLLKRKCLAELEHSRDSVSFKARLREGEKNAMGQMSFFMHANISEFRNLSILLTGVLFWPKTQTRVKCRPLLALAHLQTCFKQSSRCMLNVLTWIIV